ncbi:CBS domain protein [Ancylostoma ceylanicum]|uniref:CBS domain protein n=1 Tax=Ancylostoma ceylanicum TaxID=53326 RepID=A0A0D6M4X6_9BILA|nr:CBS domain protein [Ancylostoma ceylanicum]
MNRFVNAKKLCKESDTRKGRRTRQQNLRSADFPRCSREEHVPQTATCDDAITLFLEKKISSVPVVDSYGRVLGVIGKSDIMSELVRHPNNYLEILDIPIMDIIASMSPPVYGTTTMTVFDCIAALVNTDRQSIIIIDVERRPQAVISYSDIMDFIQNTSDSHHKLSLA